MLRSIGRQSGEFVESVLKKKKEGYSGEDLQKKRRFSAWNERVSE